jgi:hypothetical protein
MELSLGVRVLMRQLENLAKSSGFPKARVLPKVNVRGELVLGVILPPDAPGGWGAAAPRDVREEKRQARERRS